MIKPVWRSRTFRTSTNLGVFNTNMKSVILNEFKFSGENKHPGICKQGSEESIEKGYQISSATRLVEEDQTTTSRNIIPSKYAE